MKITRARTPRLLAVATVALAALLAPGAPVEAEGVTPLTFTGTASLPEFPCPLPLPPNPACQGTFSGTLGGELGGTHFGKAWTVTLDEADINAIFAYEDGNCLEGTATGSATIDADTGNAIGTYGQGDGEGRLPRVVTAVTASANFQWSRDGVAARVFPITAVNVSILVDGIGWLQVMNNGTGVGDAAFAPHIDPDDQPDCVGLTNRPAITADVVAGVVLADLS